MTPEERDRMDLLCKVIQSEKDPKKFDQYVLELNALLDANYERIPPEDKKPTVK